MTRATQLGFAGLGVMGGAMCANLARSSGRTVLAYDPVAAAMEAADAAGASPVSALTDLGRADVVFLSLPSIAEVESVARELAVASPAPRVIVDMSTSDVSRTRSLAAELAERGVRLVDAPVARLRQAAVEGTLLITVGASAELFAELEPLLRCVGSDIIHAGPTGNGQVMKVLNNMVLMLNITALAEALTIARRAGVDGELLFRTLALGSADSFALRRTATATMLPDEFPERAFPTVYAIKDLALALQLAEESGVPAQSARRTMDLLEQARDAGHGLDYYPVIIKMIDGRG
jgi:3-hydroxyisobutyrate dehydrogenase-like beta-hydroxyacid dehydrogenase